MNTEELKALQAAAATLKRGDYYLNLSASLEEAPTLLTRSTLAELAEKSINELHEARASIEAHAASGLAFPALAEELFNLLEAGRPEWLACVNKRRAEKWEAEARAILAAVGRSFEGMPIEGGDPPTYPRIYTRKSDAALQEIFSELAAAGFIARTDEDGRDMQADFLNSFDRSGKPSAGIVYNSKPRGRIIWKKCSGHGPNKAALIAFLYHNGVEAWDSWKTIAAGIFGIELKADDKKNHYNKKDGPSTGYNAELKRILRTRL